MRSDGRFFADGGEQPRRFSETAAERPLPAYERPETAAAEGRVRDVDDVPRLDQLEREPFANVGHERLKRGTR